MKRSSLYAIAITILAAVFLLVGCSAGMPPSQTAGAGGNNPTVQPTNEPTVAAVEPSPTAQPTNEPTAAVEPSPTVQPTNEPTVAAEPSPTAQPTIEPTVAAVEPSPEASEDEGSPELQSNWKVVLDTKILHRTHIEGFLDEQYGISVGYGGEIHYTNDGGKTWPKGENKSMCRYSLDVVDENLAWCGGNGNHVRVTRDGGKNWTAVSDINMLSAHSNIDFIDDTNGWICTLADCAATKDGGATWTELTLPEHLSAIAAVCLRTPEDGYLLKCNGLLFTTSDGGVTWSEQDLGFDKYEVYDTKKNPGLNKNRIAVADISFSDKDNGLIVFTGIEPDKGYKTWCLTTSDGGKTWESENILPPEGFSPVRVFLSGDSKFLTMGAADNRIIVMKREG